MKKRFERFMLNRGWVPLSKYEDLADVCAYRGAKLRRYESEREASVAAADLRLLNLSRRALELVRS